MRIVWAGIFIVLMVGVCVKIGESKDSQNMIIEYFTKKREEIKQSTKKKSGLEEFLESLVPEDEEVKDPLVPVRNLVGSCPPSSDMYQCPQEDQITDSITIFNEGTEKGQK